MNYRINDYEKIVNKVSKLTKTKYETDYWDCPVLLLALEDLLREYDKLQETLNKFEQDREDNYQRIDVSKQYDIDNNDFI